jgi:hypothetical protein
MRRAIQIIQVFGVALMFLGIAFRLANVSGYTIAFIAGATLILFARINILWVRRAKKGI